ncbi:MAG TPA: undecaprenyldiphospho-muramoylpentapeptide beta-N-acetylglucosaminyltransferase [Gammaproteobacteria bacterium]|nr:undecaprenyldiphospho-muramoylpentapeptide beta-N-acetylglucosaminyltransferase [Gammaproteobacteria bacterium]
MSSGVMILAGGTGGHIYPALAVAEHLRAEGVSLSWLGSAQGMEASIVPRHDIPFRTVKVAGLRGKGLLGWLCAPFMIVKATLQAMHVLREVEPGVVLGMGGFVSGPGGLAAWLCRRPLVIHEQNAIPGLTNRLLAKIATRILEAYPHSFVPAVRARCTGNPVRRAIAAIAPPASRVHDAGPARVLVVGGSLGARSLNTWVPRAVAGLAGIAVEIWHQTGRAAVDDTAALYRSLGLAARVVPFIDDMPAAYAWADLVICRAGAMTVAELAAAGCASVLVPYPHAVDDHQTANARYLAEAGAAEVVADAALAGGALAPLLQRLLSDRRQLLDMATRARAAGRPAAATAVATQCMELLDVQG